MAIFLVRHAESEANLDETLFRTYGDHAIKLSQTGLKQADKVGEFLNNYLSMNLPGKNIRLWSSPYLRTMQTAQGIYYNTPDIDWDIAPRGDRIYFDARLREREFGYFDGLNDEEIAEKYPDQWHHYQKTKKENGHYYTKPYNGESAADVCVRLTTFKESLSRDMDKGHEHHVIVNHGFTLRCFVNSYLKLHPLDFAAEKNPSNTAVRLLDRNPETGHFADYGYIYDPKKEIYLTEKPKQPKIYKPIF